MLEVQMKRAVEKFNYIDDSEGQDAAEKMISDINQQVVCRKQMSRLL